jgi:hypothetical protein
MTEKELKAEVLRLAALHGWKVFHLTHDGVKKPQKGAKGYPDLTLARRGTVYFFELKDEKGSLEPDQAEWRDAMGDTIRGYWRLVRPSHLVQIEHLLR